MRATWGTHQYTVTTCKPKQLFSDSLSGSLFFLSGETVLRVLGHKGGHLLRQLLWNGAKVAVGPEMGVHWIRAPGELLAQTKQTKSGAKSAMTTEIKPLTDTEPFRLTPLSSISLSSRIKGCGAGGGLVIV